MLYVRCVPECNEGNSGSRGGLLYVCPKSHNVSYRLGIDISMDNIQLDEVHKHG